LAGSLYALLSFRRGKVLENWQTGNDVFTIRVTARSERLALPGLGGAYYIFDARVAGSDHWNEFLVFNHDNSVSIPRDQVRFVTPQVAYVFMGWKYAVTTDGGAAWSVWDAERDLRGWQCCNYNLIQNLRVEADGKGMMTLNSPSGTNREGADLETKDYGLHWAFPDKR
jgi:hypothetical protein